MDRQLGYKLHKDRERLLQLLQEYDIPVPIVEAIARIPREAFLPAALRHFAYQNTALPIGWGQTISQPLIVARMTELLEIQQGHRVLEIGTGSGYQAALLASLGATVFTVERDRRLYEQACLRFRRLGLAIRCHYGDGYHGWKQYAPYDRILITAALRTLPPQSLLEQLVPDGLCVFPLQSSAGQQHLTRIVFSPGEPNAVYVQRFEPCEFVPLQPDTI